MTKNTQEKVQCGSVIEGSSGNHFLVVQDTNGKFQMINIDADWVILDFIFDTIDELIENFDAPDADLPEDNKLSIERVLTVRTLVNENLLMDGNRT